MITMAGGLLAGISGMSGAVAAFSAATAAGFTISETGGQALIRAIDNMHEGATDALRRAEFLSQEPPLGTTPAAQVYKPFLATIATDPIQGFIPAMRRFQDDLNQLRSKVEQAMTTYQVTDQGAGQGVTRAGGPTLTA
ncbi:MULTISPECIES: hypothetical protein [Saccharothrix]|uniref:hypothetical protein n=1 Tax=Saccharothrix TaxID=2071 RepID=UPI000939DD8F|nr:hypothetical protein [Saccharothrix sp. CB00851]OKI36899.1 hypothetical protein A6A25_20610 [Saccharothrix sp. CB00851]